MKRWLLVALLLVVLLACACDGGDGDDYARTLRHGTPSADGFDIREHKEFAIVPACAVLLLAAFRSGRTRWFRVLLCLALLLCLAACKDGGDGDGERETLRDMRDVYYVMGEGFGQKEFAGLLALGCAWLLARRRLACWRS